jgi:hypothetical protein
VLEVEDDFEETEALEVLVRRENAGRYIGEAIVFELWVFGIGLS